jgi:hypothetical protein
MSDTNVMVPQGLDIQLPVASSKGGRRKVVTAIVGGLVVVGLLAFAIVQTISLSGANSDLAASQSTVSNLRAENTGLQADLGNAQASVDSLESEVSAQDAQLASCYQANALSVKADKAFHTAVGQIMPAAFGGSDYAFDAALARYRAASRQWAVAANACEPGGGYSFG